jgi:DNA-binding Lrp family transcriptional regulator
LKIINEVKKFPGVLEANRVIGIYDILVRLSANSIDNPKELIKSRIKKIESIISTLTLVVTKERKESLIPKIEIKLCMLWNSPLLL